MSINCVIKQFGFPQQARSVCVSGLPPVVPVEMKPLSSPMLEYLIPPHICFPQFILDDSGINIYNGKQKSDLKCFP